MNLGYDTGSVAPQEALTVIPAGTYTAQAVESSVKMTKDQTGQMAQFTMQILDDGPHKGRKVFARFNIRNANETAQRIGQAQLSQFAAAAGRPSVTNTEQLHGIPVRIRVTVKKDDHYGDSNEVRQFEAAAAAGPAAAMGQMQPPPAPVPAQAAAPMQQPAPQQQYQQQPTASTPPWQQQ